jgi:hypothetical protein
MGDSGLSTLSFLDRQRVKVLEDQILDLVTIFDSLYDTLSRLQQQCRRHCAGDACPDCTCSNIIEELEEQMHDVQLNLKKVDLLHKRAQGTAQLVCYTKQWQNNNFLTRR